VSLHCCCVQPTDEMLELASDKRDEAMAAVGDGRFYSYCSVNYINNTTVCKAPLHGEVTTRVPV